MMEKIYCKTIDKEMEAHAKTATMAKEYILNSTAKYHNRVVRTMYLPKIFTNKDYEVFRNLVTVLYGIFDKVIAEYEQNAEFRKLFGFDKWLENAILNEKKYSVNIPMARIDVFYNEDTQGFKFCEFNTDGTSGMNEDRELNHALKLTKAYQEFSEMYHVHSIELFDPWVDELLNIYKEYAVKYGRNEIPNVVISDFMESATENEFYEFQKRFEQQGIRCEICDMREFKWDGTMCVTPSGMKVDVVYRRAVTSEVMKHFDEIQGFIKAYENNAFCLIGDFRTQLVHNKMIFKILHMDETQHLFTEEERKYIREHVPYTVSLETTLFKKKPELYQDVLNRKDGWIIKPEDSYGSKGVHAGVESDETKWKEWVDSCVDQNYILQEFCTPYQILNIDLAEGGAREWKPTSNMTGLFVYAGKLSGLYTRISYDKVISTQYNEMTVPTIVVELED